MQVRVLSALPDIRTRQGDDGAARLWDAPLCCVDSPDGEEVILMSAQRRTVETGQGIATPGKALPSASAVPAVGSRPPKPVAPKPPSEAQNRFGGRFEGLRGNYRDTVAELKKVNWPDRETTKNLTLVVIAVSIVLGLLLGGIDFVLQNIFAAVP